MSTLIYAVFLVGAVLVVLQTLFVISSVQKSIRKFKGTLEHISDGEIMVKAQTNNKNEFDTFGRSLNRMTDKLSEVIGDVITCGEQLNSTGAELEHVSQNCEQISDQLDVSISGIAQSRDKTAIIKSAIGECNNVRNAVSQIMMNLSAISEENAASTAETASAMQHLNNTISVLLQESQKLLSLSAQLEEDIKFFKLNGNS